MNGLPAFIIFIIIAVVSNLLSKAKEDRGVKRTPAAPLRPADDLDQAERTRRIQEEIRRKIAERRGVALPPPVPAPSLAEVEREPAEEPVEWEMPRELEPPPLPVPMAARTAALEQARQEELAAQLAALEDARAAARATAETIATARAAETNWTETTKPATGASAWRKDLRSAGDLRRAMVLREVLGPPVALR